MQITFLQDYNGIEKEETFKLDPTGLGDFSWQNITPEGEHQFFKVNAHKLAEQGIISIEEQLTTFTI